MSEGLAGLHWQSKKCGTFAWVMEAKDACPFTMLKAAALRKDADADQGEQLALWPLQRARREYEADTSASKMREQGQAALCDEACLDADVLNRNVRF